MNIQIIVFGKTSESFFCESEKHYIKRILPFAKVEWKELKAEKIEKSKTLHHIKELEANRFFEAYTSKNYLIACDVHGLQMSSEKLSLAIEKIKLQYSGITFVIGGALGLCDSILQKANMRLSLSSNTFPHDLFRTMLLEQIYRSFMIAEKREYHK